MKSKYDNTTIGIFPSRDGFGWMVFDGPLGAYQWGASALAKNERTPDAKNARCLAGIERLLSKYRPAIVVIEAFEGPGTKRHERIKHLCRSIIALSATHRLPVRIITRADIRTCFTSTKAVTRQQTATTVARWVKELRRLAPIERRLWEGEDPNMALFNATALLIAHYAIPWERG